jgi:hypothetical protein
MLFELFAETIDHMPPSAVLAFLKRMHGSMEDALSYKRMEETMEVESIISFCQFIEMVKEEDVIFPIRGVPIRHVALYGKVIGALVEAGELPRGAKGKFDSVFSAGFLESLARV